jgi:hypothetical protein
MTLQHGDAPPLMPEGARSIDFGLLLGYACAIGALAIMVAGSVAAFEYAYGLLDEILVDTFQASFAFVAFVALGIFWLFVAVVALFARGSGWPFRILLASLVPLPLALTVLGYLSYTQTLRKETFDDRRLELEARVDSFIEPASLGRRTNALSPFRIEDCVFIPLEHFIDENAGFAQCSGDRPSGTNITMRHMRDDWWWYYHMDGPFCTSDPCDLRSGR